LLENRFELEAASPLQENRIDKEVLLYHHDYYEKWEELQEEVVLFIWKPLPSAATSASHVHPPIFITQINDDDVFQRFITHMERRHDSAN